MKVATLFLNQLMYIDPSVMTYAIQAIAGIVIAIAAVVGIYFRRAKKKVSDTLKIEEKAKETEEELIVFNEELEK